MNTETPTAHRPASTQSFRTVQDWAAYSREDHEVWRLLHQRRMTELPDTASRVFLEGARAIGLRPDAVPALDEVNARLARRTGWKAIPVEGFIPARSFFECLARREFPTTVTVRPLAQLDYLPEPDIFHDVFGHVPLHADRVFADFLQEFGRAACRAVEPDEVEAMARLFWFTVEFGLIREGGATRVYGSGLISSSAEAANALGPDCDRRPFALDDIMSQPFEIDHLQPVLFIIDSFEQLFDAVSDATRRMGIGQSARGVAGRGGRRSLEVSRRGLAPARCHRARRG